MDKVCIIGNNASGKPISDGGRIKIRLYKDLLLKNGIDAYIIDLDNWKRHILSVLLKIKRAIKSKHTILIMAGPSGSRKIIPMANRINKKIKTRVVFCPLGIGTLEKVINHLTNAEAIEFLNNENYYGIDDTYMAKELKQLNLVLAQNELISNCYKIFYGLKNVVALNNFRDVVPTRKEYIIKEKMHLVYVGRICKEKGIFDLVSAVNRANEMNCRISLDIFGDLQLKENEQRLFDSLLSNNIKYIGVLNAKDSISTIKRYDMFVLPTKYIGEGTSGSLIEAFLSGTPALISSYSQAKLLISDGSDGFIYKINDQEDLLNKLLFIYNHRDKLENVGLSAQKKSIIYTFEYNKKNFLNFIVGGKQ